MSKINIAYAPDDNYIGLTVVSMVSVLDNNPNCDIEIIILHSGLTKSSLNKLDWVKSYRKCDINQIILDNLKY